MMSRMKGLPAFPTHTETCAWTKGGKCDCVVALCQAYADLMFEAERVISLVAAWFFDPDGEEWSPATNQPEMWNSKFNAAAQAVHDYFNKQPRKRASADDLAAARRMSAGIGVKGQSLIELLDEIEERRAADQAPLAAAVQDEVAWETYRTTPPTREDIEGSALRNAFFAGIEHARAAHQPKLVRPELQDAPTDYSSQSATANVTRASESPALSAGQDQIKDIAALMTDSVDPRVREAGHELLECGFKVFGRWPCVKPSGHAGPHECVDKAPMFLSMSEQRRHEFQIGVALRQYIIEQLGFITAGDEGAPIERMVRSAARLLKERTAQLNRAMALLRQVSLNHEPAGCAEAIDAFLREPKWSDHYRAIMKQAEGDGVDSTTYINALNKKVEDQRRELKRLNKRIDAMQRLLQDVRDGADPHDRVEIDKFLSGGAPT